jgi:hypothetical protein
MMYLYPYDDSFIISLNNFRSSLKKLHCNLTVQTGTSKSNNIGKIPVSIAIITCGKKGWGVGIRSPQQSCCCFTLRNFPLSIKLRGKFWQHGIFALPRSGHTVLFWSNGKNTNERTIKKGMGVLDAR